MKKCITLLILLCHCTYALGEITVVDHRQRSVTLMKPAQRIVALAPHIVENTFSAGAGDKLVGVVSYSNYPDAAKRIPEVGSYKSWSLESIAAMQPDLILMWASGNGLTTLASLEKLGIPVFVSEPRQLTDISDSIRAIGILAGTEAHSEREATRIDNELAALRTRYQLSTNLTVLYQVWNKPLQTLSGDHLISRVMQLCGAENAFADAASLAPKISLESVLVRDPDAIMASGMGAARPEWLDEWRKYPSLSAAENNALFFIHPDHIQRPTARIVLGAQSMCEQLDTLRDHTRSES